MAASKMGSGGLGWCMVGGMLVGGVSIGLWCRVDGMLVGGGGIGSWCRVDRVGMMLYNAVCELDSRLECSGGLDVLWDR